VPGHFNCVEIGEISRKEKAIETVYRRMLMEAWAKNNDMFTTSGEGF